jgi:hypothetical protein
VNEHRPAVRFSAAAVGIKLAALAAIELRAWQARDPEAQRYDRAPFHNLEEDEVP